MGALLSAMLVVVLIALAELTGTRPPEGRELEASPLSAHDGAVHLAGTGTWLPLARALVRAFQETSPGAPLVVHDSIGSGGGMRAVADGVIDVALVSSPEGELRRAPCCRVIPIAVGAVVFGVNSSVAIDGLDREQVVAIFEGRTTTWPDGSAIVPLLRERGDSATRVAVREIQDLGTAMELAWAHGRWPIFLTDADMARALEDTPGGIGLHDLGSLQLEHPRVHVLPFERLRPGIETLSDHSYPLRRTLALVLPNPPRDRVAQFVDFIRSERGREVLVQTNGYLSLAPERP
jgi:phosphate transport system substrate-binding protein